MLRVTDAPSHRQSVPLRPTGRRSRLYCSKNSYDGQLQLGLETSRSFSASGWVGSFVRQSLRFHSSSAMQCSYRGARFWGKKKSLRLFLERRDNSRSLFNCSLVRVLIISSAKWEMLKTDKSTANHVLWSPEAGHTDSPCRMLFHLNLLNLSSPFIFFPVVKMNMVVSSQLSSITELNLALLTAETTGHRLFCLCCAAGEVM